MISIDNKLYIKDIDTYIDPFFPVERAIITHGHADHARSGHKHVLCTRETAEIITSAQGTLNCIGQEATLPVVEQMAEAVAAVAAAGHH